MQTTDTVDQTETVLHPPFSLQGFLLNTLGRLPWWAILGLLSVLAVYARKTVRHFQLQSKIGKYRLDKRRKHGIPDSDQRPFREAVAEAVLKKREMVQTGTAGITRRLDTDRKALGIESVNESLLQLVPPTESIPKLAYASSSKYGSYAARPEFDEPSRKDVGFGSGSILDQGYYDPPSRSQPTQTFTPDIPPAQSRQSSSRKPSANGKPNRTRKRLDESDESASEASEGEAGRKVDGGRKRRRQVGQSELGSDGGVPMEAEEEESGEDGSGMDDEDERSSSAEASFSSDDSMMDPSFSDRSVSPPPAFTSKQKRQISEVESVGSKRSFKKRTKSNAGESVERPLMTVDDMEEEEESQDEIHAEGEVWNDPNGIRFRVGKNGRGRERLVLVKKVMRKYDMPIDSEHPDKDQTIIGNVEQWVTETEFKELRAQKQLAWQSDDEETESSTNGTSEAGPEQTPLSRSISRGNSSSPGLYQLIGRSSAPLRSSTSLADLRQSFSGAGGTQGSPMRSTVASDKLRMSTSSLGLRALYHGDLLNKIGDSPKTVMSPRALGERERRTREARMLDRLRVESSAAANAAGKEIPRLGLGKSQAGAPSSSTPSVPALPAPTLILPAPSNADKPATTSVLNADKTAAPSVPDFFAKPSVPPPNPTPAGSTFSFGASKPEPAKPAPTGGAGFSFSKPVEIAAKAASPLPDQPPATFSFGAPAAPKPVESPKPAESSKPASTPSFSFGANTTPKATSPLPEKPPATFSFGAPAALKPVESPKPTSSTPSFSFGSSTTPKAAEDPKPFAASFAFGAPSKPVETSNPSASSFSFGAPSKAVESSTLSSSSSFSFGATAPDPKIAGSSSPFAFSASSKPAEIAPSSPVTSLASTPSFNFGKPAAAPATNPTPTSTAPSFNFGAPANSPVPSASSFSFGTPPSADPVSKPSSSFSFGAPASTAANPPSFSFGSKAPEATAPATTGFSFGAGAPATGTFSFGK